MAAVTNGITSDIKRVSIIKVLRQAKREGVNLRIIKGKMWLTGKKDAKCLPELKKYREDLHSLLKNPTKGINDTVERLQHGQRLLISQFQSLWDANDQPIGSEKAVSVFADTLSLWDLLDMLLRGYKDCPDNECPIGPNGCDPESPVSCRACEAR